MGSWTFCWLDWLLVWWSSGKDRSYFCPIVMLLLSEAWKSLRQRKKEKECSFRSFSLTSLDLQPHLFCVSLCLSQWHHTYKFLRSSSALLKWKTTPIKKRVGSGGAGINSLFKVVTLAVPNVSDFHCEFLNLIV